MSQTTGIQWTDATWNPVRGCSRISEGCRNCYAERQAARFCGAKPGEKFGRGPFNGFVHIVNGHPAWTGKVELVERHLEDPLHWREPRRVFVNSMSDLWHEKLPADDQAWVYAVMAVGFWHTYQVLTKRPHVRLDQFRESVFAREVESRALRLIADNAVNSVYHPEIDKWKFIWPLPNVWEGVSVEDFKTWDERVHLLKQTPAAVRFVSYEPALEDLGCVDLDGIDWVIVGGESGPEARPFDIQWALNTIEQCKAAGVACFVKQLGAAPFDSNYLGSGCDADLDLDDRKGGEMAEWPEWARVREFPR